MSLSTVEEVVPRVPAPGVLAPAVLAFASGYVEVASILSATMPDTWQPWSFTIHNRGDLGIFGGAIGLLGGPSPVKVRWGAVETDHPVGGNYRIIYYEEAQPNCTRLETSGEILFPSAGDYKIRVGGVHLEGETWILDHYLEFTVTVEVPQGWVWWWPWAAAGGGLALVVVVAAVAVEERRKEEMLMMMARGR